MSRGRRLASRATRASRHETPVVTETYVDVVTEDLDPTPASSPEVASHPVDPADDDVANQPAYWDVWREPIGRAVHPVLEELHASLPGATTTTIAFTPEGLAIASTNLDEEEAGRVSALAAPAYAMALSALGNVSRHDQDGVTTDSISLTHGESRALVVAVHGLIVGTLLLWVSADDTNLGVITFQTKAAAQKITGLLVAREEPGAHDDQHAAPEQTDNHTN